MRKSMLLSALLSVVLCGVGVTLDPAPAMADRHHSGPRDHHPSHRHDPPWEDRHHRDRWDRHGDYRHWRESPRHLPHYRYDRHWRPHRRHYHHHGNDFLGWLAFTAVTLAIIDSLDNQQQREHELALRQSLRAPVGETIHWHDGGASGSVTTLRDGTSSAGRYCREYTQEVKLGGRSQQVYGTACRNADGSWEIVE